MGKHAFFIDWPAATGIVILNLLGLATLLSIDHNLFFQQLVFSVLGLLCFYLFSRIEFKLYHYLDKYIYVLCILFLLITFLGPSIRGATRWLEFGGIRIQPSEIIKPFLWLSFASLFTRLNPEKLNNLIKLCCLFLIPILLIFRQPDLGNVIVYVCAFIGLIILSGTPVIYLLLTAIIGGLSFPLLRFLLKDYQRERLMSFINPSLDPKGIGYNAIQSMIAVGSGLIFGRGFGRGTQSILKFLPERHTDFIFATFAEEFGLVGSLVLLIIFIMLFWRMLKHSETVQNNMMAFLYITALFTQMFVQVVVNIGMNMGILPITGITLPLVSAGGSSLLATYIGLGIYMAAIQKKE